MANPFGRNQIVPLTNKSGASVAAGDFVYIDTANNDAFTTGTTANYTKAIGIAQQTIANGAVGLVLIQGYASLVNVNASVTRGNFLASYTVAKQGTDGGASRVAGSCGMFLTGGTTPDAIIWQPDLGSGTGMTNPMTTTGDLIYSSSGSTPARLGIGNAGGVLAMGNSLPIWNAGTSFPGSKATNDRYYRTDLEMEFYWDGTRWVTTEVFEIAFGLPVVLLPNTVSPGQTISYVPVPHFHGGSDLWMVAATITSLVGTNDGSNFWGAPTVDKVNAANSATNLISGNTTASDTAANWVRTEYSIGALLGGTTYKAIRLGAGSKTGSPSGQYLLGEFSYRIVAT